MDYITLFNRFIDELILAGSIALVLGIPATILKFFRFNNKFNKAVGQVDALHKGLLRKDGRKK